MYIRRYRHKIQHELYSTLLTKVLPDSTSVCKEGFAMSSCTPQAPIPRLRISIRIHIAYPDKKGTIKLMKGKALRKHSLHEFNNVGAILVARISIRINFVRKGVRIESLSETFYPHTDVICTAFSKIRRQKDIKFNIFSKITKMYVNPI